MGSPRVDVVFRLGQCDKENQGWCEGPPLDRCLLKFRSAGRAFTLRQSQSRTKKEYCFASVAASPSFTGHWPVIFGNTEAIDVRSAALAPGLCVPRRGKGLPPLAPRPHPRYDHPAFASLRTDFT
jgi:hypothetical protein